MGAKVAPKKSLLFGSTKALRQRLKRHIWSGVGAAIKLALHARDLGGHINTTAKCASSTLTGRRKAAAGMAKRLARFGTDDKHKAATIRMKTQPHGLIRV